MAGRADRADPLAIGVIGAHGRMGAELVRAVQSAAGVRLAAALVRPGGAGSDSTVTDDPAGFFAAIDITIDVSLPEAAAEHAEAAAAAGVPLVMAVTGLEAKADAALAQAAKRIAVLSIPNASQGIAVLMQIVRRAARALGSDYDIEVLNAQHRKKADAPSGAALALGRAAAGGRGVDLTDVQIRGRDGETGARPQGAIGFSAVAGGEGMVGHGVSFLGDGETVALSHFGAGRGIYTAGLIRAALWAPGRAPGLYSMADVLGLG